ncbi:hypothetical protein LIER_18132 [Lithospermum erythrorhizon]|uniref:Uncharacterized protein n=1 Tax=Lithospermum erythrorhizon TaxID=34254 RepID=A0AAV3QHA6_LITER
MGFGAFWGTRVLEIVKKHDSGGLVWKRIKLTSTRKANAKKRLRRVWQAKGLWSMIERGFVEPLENALLNDHQRQLLEESRIIK